MNRCRALLRLLPLIAAGTLLQGCLLVRSTEHRIWLNGNGGGEAIMRLIDIRSDGATDSARVRDFGIMMASVELDGLKEFEQFGRKVIKKQFRVSGDTLSAEITYTFAALEALEGMKVTEDEISVTVNDAREIVRTNGSVSSGELNTKHISWPRDARRLMYEISERSMPPSTSLAGLYLRYEGGKGDGGR
ncbi:MAG: hypothetical protein AB1428_02135 [Bacteroidota bacterium]